MGHFEQRNIKSWHNHRTSSVVFCLTCVSSNCFLFTESEECLVWSSGWLDGVRWRPVCFLSMFAVHIYQWFFMTNCRSSSSSLDPWRSSGIPWYPRNCTDSDGDQKSRGRKESDGPVRDSTDDSVCFHILWWWWWWWRVWRVSVVFSKVVWRESKLLAVNQWESRELCRIMWSDASTFSALWSQIIKSIN